jgi:lysophospholipase L1-like esterase
LSLPAFTQTDSLEMINSQWEGKKVAFLGDSMTDKCRVGTTCIYWEYLVQLLGIKPFVYGVNGAQWNGIYNQAVKLNQEQGNAIDAIIVFAGTNDYNANTPLGTFYSEKMKQTNHNGKMVMRKYREPVMTDSTFCGRINMAISYLKQNFSTQQIIIMTPIHRGYAQFGANNIQPEESYCNGCGLYLEAYVNILKRASLVWSVPIIDLYSLSGLYPLYDTDSIYFHNATTDRLHPNAKGDYRLAKTIQYQLLPLPASFK